MTTKPNCEVCGIPHFREPNEYNHPLTITDALKPKQDNMGRDIAHSITIDEDTADDGAIFAAFCTDACGWVGAWHHACDFDDGPGARRAEINAENEGQDHLDGCAA